MPTTPSVRNVASPFVVAAVLVACGGAGRWGHARNYVPNSEEKSQIEGARELDAPMAQLKPEQWKGAKVRFFLVVSERKPAPGGAAYLTGKIATLNEVNNCENKYDDDSCRVTIKPTLHETVHATIALRAEDDVGELRVGTGTLVRVVGQISDATDPDDGKLVVQGAWYRQWPIGYYIKEGDFKQ
ncbi:MAG: hypothetical protein IPJ34_43810 [Myxococcales bacterium]|nr:hypothetical protein [Myxococcales bacterium]